MISLWSDTAELPHFGTLQKELKADVLIIGGGMAGTLCAYMLSQAGVPYVLVEADRLCQGITKNTTAKITSQHGLIYGKLIDRFGTDMARMYLQANQTALSKYRELCGGIDCDFESKDAFIYCLNSEEKIEKELKALDAIGFQAEQTKDLPLPFPVAGAIRFGNQAQFHPLKFISQIARGLNIYENTPVRTLDGTTAVTPHGKITAKKILVTTHFPFLNTHGLYFLKLYQHRSYVLALENAPDVHGMYLDDDHKGLSFRNHGQLLLVGGGSHRTGKNGGNFQELSDFARRHYPQAREKYRWATQDCMTLDDVAYIGHYAKTTPDLYVATGFNKWGMTTSMVAATILTDMVMGKHSPYAPVFSPSRSILRPQLAANAFEAITGLLTPVTKRCPHMGCALKWNPQERSWDCSCHGSRFTKDGQLIDNPATGDLKHGKQK